MWLLLTKLLCGRHQLGGGRFQSPGQNVNVEKTNVPFPTFNATDVGTVKTSDASEGVLGQSCPSTKGAESEAEGV